jgi:hypothetical protein
MKQPRGKRVSIDRENGWLCALQPLDATRLRTPKLQCKSEQPALGSSRQIANPSKRGASLAIFKWTRQRHGGQSVLEQRDLVDVDAQ